MNHLTHLHLLTPRAPSADDERSYFLRLARERQLARRRAQRRRVLRAVARPVRRPSRERGR